MNELHHELFLLRTGLDRVRIQPPMAVARIQAAVPHIRNGAFPFTSLRFRNFVPAWTNYYSFTACQRVRPIHQDYRT